MVGFATAAAVKCPFIKLYEVGVQVNSRQIGRIAQGSKLEVMNTRSGEH